MANAPHKSRISVSTKLALGIVVVVGIVAFLYYNPSDLSFGGLGQVGSGLTDIFGSDSSGERLNFTMASSENFFKDELVLEDASILANGVHTADTSVGDSVFENMNDEASVSFEGFNGRMTLKDGTLTIDGSADNAGSEGARIKPKSKSFAVSAQLSPSSYTISPVTIGKISLVRVFGSIERLGDESSTTTLSNSTVQITDFQGSMSYDGKDYVLTGSATEVKGKSFTLKG